jgi:hypothetical protein
MLTLNSHAHCALSFSLCFIHCALFTVLYSLCVIHCALFTVLYSLCFIHCALFTVRYSLCVIHCALFTVRYSLCVIQCALFTVRYSLCVIHCVLFTVLYSLCFIHCAPPMCLSAVPHSCASPLCLTALQDPFTTDSIFGVVYNALVKTAAATSFADLGVATAKDLVFLDGDDWPLLWSKSGLGKVQQRKLQQQLTTAGSQLQAAGGMAVRVGHQATWAMLPVQQGSPTPQKQAVALEGGSAEIEQPLPEPQAQARKSRRVAGVESGVHFSPFATETFAHDAPTAQQSSKRSRTTLLDNNNSYEC